mgnify:CR=1 FL=1
MHFWLVLGVFLLGCGLGSLATAAFYLAQLRKIKNYLQHVRETTPQNFPDAANQAPDKRSA